MGSAHLRLRGVNVGPWTAELLGQVHSLPRGNCETRRFFNAQVFLSALLLAGLPQVLAAGPVPGAESSPGSPVSFPLPPSIIAVDPGNNHYRVTFSWEPETPVEEPRTAGAFNGWDRSGTPMTGPGAQGRYSATLESDIFNPQVDLLRQNGISPGAMLQGMEQALSVKILNRINESAETVKP